MSTCEVPRFIESVINFSPEFKCLSIVKELKPGYFGPTFLMRGGDGLMILKTFTKQSLGSSENVFSFKKRLEQMKELRNNSIVNPETIFDCPKFVGYTRKYIDSSSLTDVIEGGGFHDPMILADVFRTVVKTVQFLHSESIFATSISTNNIFVGANGVSISDVYSIPQKISLANQRQDIQHLAFLAPEYFGQNEIPDASSDVWALASVLVYMFTGAFPWNTRNLFGMLKQIQTGELIFSIDTPKCIRKIAMASFVTKKAERPTMEQFVHLLESELIASRSRNSPQKMKSNQKFPSFGGICHFKARKAGASHEDMVIKTDEADWIQILSLSEDAMKA